MEINITKYFDNEEHCLVSGSRAELGDNAGAITWQNALESAQSDLLPQFTPEEIEEIRDYFGTFGAWDDEERAAWSIQEIRALVSQLISGDIREIENVCSDEDGEIDWEEYQKESEAGRVSGRIFGAADDEKFYYIGN